MGSHLKPWFSDSLLSQSLFRGWKSHLHSFQRSQERFSHSHQNVARQHQQINERQEREIEMCIEFNSDSL